MPLRKGSSRSIISQNIREFHTGDTYEHTERKFGKRDADSQAVAVALDVARRSKRRRRADGGSVDDLPDVGPPLIGDGGQFSPGTDWGNRAADIGTKVGQAIINTPKAMLWDLPRTAVENARSNPLPGLRREDYTDLPPDTSPDPSSPLGGVGISVPRQGWQPVDPMVGSSLEAASNVMGGTAVGAPEKAAGEFVAGAGPVRRGAGEALDMSPEARMARAQQQGFDTSQPLYHGTSKDADFGKFKDSRHGTWTTTDPESASSYAKQNDSQGYRLASGSGYKLEPVNTASRVMPLYGKPLENPYTGPVPDSVRRASNYKNAQSDWFDQLRRQGHDGVLFPGSDGQTVRVDFNNSSLRGQFAPYDPKNAGKSMILGAGAGDKRAAGAAALDEVNNLLSREKALSGGPDVAAARQEQAATQGPAATQAAGEVGSGGGGSSGARSLPEAQAAASAWAGSRRPLEGLQGPLMIGDDHFVPGPIGKIHDVAEQYMREAYPERPYTPPERAYPLDPEHSKAIAQAYEDMPHSPNDPATKASYDAMIRETEAQYNAIKKTGLKVEPIRPGMEDPYAANPRLAAKDVAENNHLWFYPTEQGFGTVNKISDNPMLRDTGQKIGDHNLLANDMFRIVHDYFGHLKEGHGFRAAGEDNAWRTHAQMYSDIARPAMTTETRGQNSWVNYGPHGEANRKASAADTIYADQKVGLMPEWTMRDRLSAPPIMVYHGTPHTFDRFDINKIGSGEGNQAYGHGLYFAGHEPVSEWYRHQLATRQDPLLKKYGLQEVGHTIGSHLSDVGGDATKLAHQYAGMRDKLIASGAPDKATTNMIKEYDRRIKYLNDPKRSTGQMYQVGMHVNPEHLLDYEAPFSQQSGHVQERVGPDMEQSVNTQKAAIERVLEQGSMGRPGSRFSRPLSTSQRQDLEGRLLSLQQVGHNPFPGKDIYKRMGLPAMNETEGAVKASQRLRDLGIPGLHYPDAGSRAPGQKGSRNYVMFGDEPLKILRRYDRGGAVEDAMVVARRVRAGGGGIFDYGAVPDAMPENIGRDRIMDPLVAGPEALATLPRRAIENSQNALDTGTYDPGPTLEAATLPMGTGAMAGIKAAPGEMIAGSGPVRRIADDTGAAMRAARNVKKYSEPEFTENGSRIINKGAENPPDPSIQTVADPHRMMYPGIYGNPRTIAEEAASRVGEEDPAMKRLFGVTRGDLREMAQGRVGNEEPNLHTVANPRGAVSAQNIQTPQNMQRLVDILGEAGQHEGLRTADAWYIMDPVYRRMVEMFGPEEAAVRYRRLNTLTGMASPGSDVMTEIQRGTGAHWLNEQGRFGDFAKYAGVPETMRSSMKYPQDLRYISGHPYHRTAQGDPMAKYLEAGSIQSKAPKVPLYVHASGVPETGFQTSGPVGDAHFSRGVGLSDTRRGPSDVQGSFSTSEYQTLQPWWQHDVAGKVGLESVPAQARLWTALGPQTGVESELGAPKLELLAKQIMTAAKRLRVSPEKARDMILSGKAGAGLVAGGIMAPAAREAMRGDEDHSMGGAVNSALAVARNLKRASGGKVHVGKIVGHTDGRADEVPMAVPDGSYVIPADICSALGEGNTISGFKKLGRMFPKSKPSLMREMRGKDVPIYAADGEFVISPADISDRWSDLDTGHRYLDKWVLAERKNLIRTLSTLKPPAQD